MSELKQTMQHAREFIAANLAECCRDELNWQDTGLLVDGKLREASEIYALIEDAHAMPMAQAEVARQAMQLACRTQPEATKPAQDESDEDTWRRLALQFDGHRMMALSHLRAMLQDAQKHAPLVEAFLKAPPMDGETVLAQRIASLASPADALGVEDRVDAERYRFLRDHGVPETDAEIEKALTVYQGVGLSSLLPDELDSAIDAAIQAQKDGHHE